MNELEDRIAAAIGRRGPVPFSEVMEAALYDPAHGFYATSGAAGRRGDFLTSPEVGPVFGAVIARALDRWWRDTGEPDPFVVVEGGAGVGTLAVSVLAARPSVLGQLCDTPFVSCELMFDAAFYEALRVLEPLAPTGAGGTSSCVAEALAALRVVRGGLDAVEAGVLAGDRKSVV